MHFAASQCRGGRLVVSELQPLPERGTMSGILLWVMGGQNDHSIEYQLFYGDLRADAVARVAVDRAARAASASPEAAPAP